MSEEKELPVEFLRLIKVIKNKFGINHNFVLEINKSTPFLEIKVLNDNNSIYKIIDFRILASDLLIAISKKPFSALQPLESKKELNSSNLIRDIELWESLILEKLLLNSIFNKELKTKETSTYTKFFQNLLPTCLKQIQVRNYKSIKQTEIIDIPENSQWVFLIGENGFGKTIMLQSIFISLFGNVDNDRILTLDSDYEVLSEFKTVDKIFENRNSHNGNGSNNQNPLNNIVAIGASRLNLANESASEVNDKSTRSYSMFYTDGLLLNIESELIRFKLKNDSKFDIIKSALLTLLNPYVDDIIYNDERNSILYREKDIESNIYPYVTYNELASGFKSIVGLAGDILIRLLKNQHVSTIEELNGIVLIDELDLHLHPKYQVEIVKSFTKVFPNIQFIVSTHSPMPLLGAPLTSQVYKVNRTQEEGVFVERMEVDFSKLTPNLLLTSPIFDMDSIKNVNVSLDEIQTEDDYDEMVKNEEVDEFLANRENIKRKYPETLIN